MLSKKCKRCAGFVARTQDSFTFANDGKIISFCLTDGSLKGW